MSEARCWLKERLCVIGNPLGIYSDQEGLTNQELQVSEKAHGLVLEKSYRGNL